MFWHELQGPALGLDLSPGDLRGLYAQYAQDSIDVGAFAAVLRRLLVHVAHQQGMLLPCWVSPINAFWLNKVRDKDWVEREGMKKSPLPSPTNQPTN